MKRIITALCLYLAATAVVFADHHNVIVNPLTSPGSGTIVIPDPNVTPTIEPLHRLSDGQDSLIFDEFGQPALIPYNDYLRSLRHPGPRTAADQVFVTVSDYQELSNPVEEFASATFGTGDHVLNINGSRKFVIEFQMIGMTTPGYIKVVDDNGHSTEVNLATDPKYLIPATSNPTNESLLGVFRFTILDRSRREITQPVTITLRNQKRYSSVRFKNIAKLQPGLVCTPNNSAFYPPADKAACIDRFDYEDYIRTVGDWAKALNYADWNADERTLFFSYLSQMEKTGSMDIAAQVKGVVGGSRYFPDKCGVDYTEKEAKSIALLYAAHALFLEVNGKLNWSVAGMSADLLQGLFHPSYLFYELEPGGSTRYRSARASNKMPHNRLDWAITNLMKATAEETLDEISRWVSINVRHAMVGMPDPLCTPDWESFRRQSPMMSSGCGQTSAVLASLARAMNIPAFQLRFGHRMVYFPSQQRGMLHGDDAYDLAFHEMALKNPVADLGLSLQAAMHYYRSVSTPDAKKKDRDAFRDYDNLYNTYDNLLDFLNLRPDSFMLTQACLGWDEFQSALFLHKNARGQADADRLYCCTLDYGKNWDRLAQGDQCKKPPANLDCAAITAKANACDDVRWLSDADAKARRFNQLAPGSVAEARFRDNIILPTDFESFARKNPDYNLVHPGGVTKPRIENQDQYKRLVRYVMGNTKTKVLKSW